MRRLKVAACQLNPVVGDLEGNATRILEWYERLEADGVDVAVFPELALTGYPPEDLVLKPRFVADNLAALDGLAARTGRCALVVGFVDRRRDLYNAAALCLEGRVALSYHKRVLPNYSVFDEYRTFTPGTEALRLVEVQGVKVGLTICEDSWSPVGPMLDLAAGGAEVVLNLNASPYRAGRIEDRAVMLATRAADNSCAIVYVNQVGGQDELVFDGGSMIFDHRGHLITRAPLFTEHVLVCDLDVEPVFRKRRLDPRGSWVPTDALPVTVLGSTATIEGPPSIPEPAELPDPLEEVWQALVLGTRDYAAKNGFTDVGVALSGGIDSTLVVAVAAEAVGPERVHAVLMPSRYSSEHSLSDSIALCRNLGVEHRTIAIESAHAAMLDMLAPSFEGREADTTEENLQSRIRGMVMMSLSNKLGWLVLTTGNKSETSVGYSTLYGDTAGGFAVIKDVGKLTVYDLARWCNQRAGREVIPEHIITKPPSAELRPDQRDDQSLPPYEVLDPILDGYVEQDLTASELIELGHDEDVVRRIVRLVDLAEYKRRQSAPGIRITDKAFGRDRRVPITNRYRG
jgi:NAD+ synthase (glutamine-hydrolysing)